MGTCFFPVLCCCTPGLEFDEQVVRLGNHTKFRVAAKVSFPRYFPWGRGRRTTACGVPKARAENYTEVII